MMEVNDIDVVVVTDDVEVKATSNLAVNSSREGREMRRKWR